MNSFRDEVVKTYPPRGPLQQYRLAAATSLPCFRCGQTKTSKLITVFRGDWTQGLCNGCYGYLLSIHEIRAGGDEIERKAEALADELLHLVPTEGARRREELLLVLDRRAEGLQLRTLRLLATADYVATQLERATDLDWSAAVIGLCKAVEVEFVTRLLEPLAEACTDRDLHSDIDDKDMRRVAQYCAGRVSTPPELGALAHFLRTAAYSKKRQASSELLKQLRRLLRSWPHSDWLVSGDDGAAAIDLLTTRFRNPAAHTDELSRDDYEQAYELVAGGSGLLWELLRSTQAPK